MLYSDLYLQKKKHNSFIMLSVVAIMTISVFTFYVFNKSALPTRASKNSVKRTEVTNVSPHQVTIFWEVDTEDNGWVILGKDPQKLGTISLDERDTDKKKGKYRYHYSILESLDSDTTYYYKIVSDNRLIERNGNEPFSFKTPREITFTSPRTPAYGKVILPNGEAAQDAMVIIKYKNGYPFFASTKINGEWLVPLQYSIDKDTHQMVTIEDNSKLEIEIMGSNLTSKIESLIGRMSPVPQTIILGQDYKFLEDKNEVLPAFIKKETQKNKSYSVDVTYPKNLAVIPGTKPLIRGVGVPGNDVVVNINSIPPFSAKVTIDDRGSWNVPVDRTILPGSYNLIVTTEDAFGRKVGFKRRFTIAKSGEQVVLGEATGSASLTPSPSPSPSPTGTAITTSPTSVYATVTVQPTTMYDITDVPEPPATGISNIGPYVVTGFGLLILGAGIFMFL